MIYPLLTWLVPVPAFTITVTANAVTEVLSVPDGVYYGWLTTGTDDFVTLRTAAAESLAGVLRATLQTHSEMGTADLRYGSLDVANVVGGVTASGDAIGIYVVDTPADTEIVTSSDAASLRLFGLVAGDVLGEECIIARRTAGVWRPKFAPPARLEPLLVAIGSGAISEYSAATQDRLLFGGRLIWSVVWEYVEAADISRELLTVADYLPLALRAPGDTRGTLDDLLWAMAQGAVPLLALPPKGTDAISYREVIMDVSGSIDRGAYTTEAAVGARRYNVTMTFTETQDYDPESNL